MAKGDSVRLLKSTVMSRHYAMVTIFGLIEPEVAPFDPPTPKIPFLPP